MSKAMTVAALLIAVVALMREPTAAQPDAPSLQKWEYATVISNGDPKQKLTELGQEGFDLVQVGILANNEHARAKNQLIYILQRPKQ